MNYKNVRLTEDNYQDRLELNDLIGIQDYREIWAEDLVLQAKEEAQVLRQKAKETLALAKAMVAEH